MADYLYKNVKLHVRHEPEFSSEVDAGGQKYQKELPGFIEVGFEADGAFHPIFRQKAPFLFENVERAKAEKAAGKPDDAAAPDTED